ncbi:MAG: nucleotide exchange factor GrpE [Clostridiales bacterium]|nr:nucleotide exchange factor GrpE [Clostridiales bacterium]
MTKKTDKTEPFAQDAAKEEATAASAAQETEAAQSVVTGPVDDAEQESYTLTAEEFAAAKAHIETITKEKDETVALLQRIQADFDNFRRRNASVRLDSYEEGKRDVVKELLPALDSLERALESIPADQAIWRDGIVLVQRQMLDALKKLGLEEIESDCKFDPTKHEAVMREKADGKDSGEIVVVLQKGYRMGDRIIRHCMVKVAE